MNCVAYGPFDNGHILLGLSDGWLLAYEFPSLERVDCKQVYKQPRDAYSEENISLDSSLNPDDDAAEASSSSHSGITSIEIDPTNLILTINSRG